MKAKVGDRIIYTQPTTEGVLYWAGVVRNVPAGYRGSLFKEHDCLFQIKLIALKSELLTELIK